MQFEPLLLVASTPYGSEDPTNNQGTSVSLKGRVLDLLHGIPKSFVKATNSFSVSVRPGVRIQIESSTHFKVCRNLETRYKSTIMSPIDPNTPALHDRPKQTQWSIYTLPLQY